MDGKPHRILMVATSIGRGGAERQIVDLARHLRARGWEIAILSMISATDEHLAELSAAGIEVASLDIVPGRPTLSALRRYAAHVRSWHPEIVHSHMVHANLLARAGRPLTRSVPLISTVHNVVEGGRWREIAYRLTDRLASVTTAVSTAANERYVRVKAVPRHRIITLRNGLDLTHLAVAEGARDRIRQELGIAESEFLWVSLGRLVPAKGYDILLHAFDIVRRELPGTRLAIGGDGPEADKLRRLRDRLGQAGSAALLGDRMDAPAVLAAADSFVLSSRWEGLPMVLLEAGALGLPIVATDVGGSREVAQPELGAILTSPTAESIAAGMIRIQQMGAEDRASLGRALQHHVLAEFDMERIVDRWERLYLAVLANKDRTASVDWANGGFSA